jgi:flagellar hook-associated protein 1
VSFAGLYTGLSGVRAAQTGIDVTSHNVANASTPGYTRQRVELAAAHSFTSPAGQIGSGVKVEEIGRLRDAFLDDRYRSAIGDHAGASVKAELLASLEQLAGEPDHGLSNRFARLWDAVDTWANDPADTVARNQVLAELSSVGDGFRTVAESWDALAADTEDRMATVADTVGQRLATLDDLNRKIVGADPAKLGAELPDQRDMLLDELASLTGAHVRIDDEGRAVATIGGQTLLGADGPASVEVDREAEPPTITVTSADDPAATIDVASFAGELGALHSFLTEDLNDLRGELDDLAAVFVEAINQTNAGGYRADGGAGGDLLEATSAADLRIIDGVGPDALAAAGAAGAGPHDPGNAEELATLRNARLSDGGAVDADGRSLEARLADHITGLAASVRTERSNADAARSTYKSAELARASEHGVSIDEEMVGLVRYQRSLEAASRVMTTIDEALEVLVNRTGIVGR